ncbi:MAG TPA: type II CAAX endopeptidase family protein [Halomicronema sp.]
MKIEVAKFAHYPAPARLIIFLLILVCLWAPFAIPIYAFVKDANLVSIITMVILYAEFIFLARWWGKKVYKQPEILQDYGLEFTRRNGRDLLNGLALGVISLFALFITQGLLGWVIWQKPASTLAFTILEGLIMSLAVGFAEELLFRGWLLDELQRDYSLQISLLLNGLIFAISHYIRPLDVILTTWPQIIGLFLLGLTLVWGKRSTKGKLGFSMGFHGGLVWGYYIVRVGNLIKYSGKVPEIITGVNQNPLAGVLGLLFLGTIALWVSQQTKIKNSETHP